jgi:hypothetical protein
MYAVNIICHLVYPQIRLAELGDFLLKHLARTKKQNEQYINVHSVRIEITRILQKDNYRTICSFEVFSTITV